MNPKMAMWCHLAIMFVVVLVVALNIREDRVRCRLPILPRTSVESPPPALQETIHDLPRPWSRALEDREAWMTAESQEEVPCKDRLEFWRSLQVERPFEFALKKKREGGSQLPGADSRRSDSDCGPILTVTPDQYFQDLLQFQQSQLTIDFHWLCNLHSWTNFAMIERLFKSLNAMELRQIQVPEMED